ncbi:hypothetical protein ALC62_11723, partial [Cyphomyrmex costatus]
SQPDSFTVQITQNEHVVYGTKLLIRYNPHIGIFSYPEMNPVNVVFDQTFTKFDRKLNKKKYTIPDCRLFLSMNIKDSTKSKFAKDVFIHYVQSYKKQYLCKIAGTIDEKQLQNINKCHICHKCRCDKDRIIHPDNLTVDLNINVPIDNLLKKVINYIKYKMIKNIDLPKLKDTHYIGIILGITIPCYFNIHNGILRNLSDLKRTEDAIISNVGRTQSIQAGFGLSTVKFQYNYTFTIGFITFSGKINGTVDGLSIVAKLIIDYDKECNVNVKYVKVKIGQIALQITNLGLLTNYITNYITSLINTEVHNRIEDFEKIIEQKINKFLKNPTMII